MLTRKPIALLFAAAIALPALAIAAPRPTPKPFAATTQQRPQPQARAVQRGTLGRNLAAAKFKARSLEASFQKDALTMRQTAHNSSRKLQTAHGAADRALAAVKADLAAPTAESKARALAAIAEAKASLNEFKAAFLDHSSATRRFNQTEQQRNQAISQLVSAQQAAKRGPPAVARPAFNAGAALPRAALPQVYYVVQQPSVSTLMNAGTTRVLASSNAPGSGGTAGSGRSRAYAMSFQQSDSTVRSSASFHAFNQANGLSGQ